MTSPTQMRLHGFIATTPELTFIGNGEARFRVRAGIEQWRRGPNGDLTRLEPVFCDLVLFGRRAELAYDRFRKGDQFVASGYINEYERQRDGHTVPCEEFVARRMGHDSFRTRYTIDREHPTAPPPTATATPQPAVGASAGTAVSAQRDDRYGDEPAPWPQDDSSLYLGDLGDTGGGDHLVRPINWNTLTAGEAEHEWLDLNRWVDWLRRAYGLPPAIIPPMWHRHARSPNGLDRLMIPPEP